MAPKRKATGESSRTAFNNNLFISQEAQDAYYAALLKPVSFVDERGLAYTLGANDGIANIVDMMAWQQLCAQPNEAVLTLVREFYANAKMDKYNTQVWVRGKIIDYSPAAICHALGLQDCELEEDEYEQLRSNADYREILDEICVPGADRTTRHGGVWTVKTSALTRPNKAWLYFAISRIMPTHHTTEFTRPMGILLFCIQEGRRFSVGRLITFSIRQSIIGYDDKRPKFVCPSLITALCIAAGVEVLSTDERKKPREIIGEKMISRLKVQGIPDVPVPPEGTDRDPATPARPRRGAAAPAPQAQPGEDSNKMSLFIMGKKVSSLVAAQEEMDRRMTKAERRQARMLGIMEAMALQMQLDLSHLAPFEDTSAESEPAADQGEEEEEDDDDSSAEDDDESEHF